MYSILESDTLYITVGHASRATLIPKDLILAKRFDHGIKF